MNSKTTTGIQYSARSMNGVITLTDGSGTVITNGTITTDGVTVNGDISADNIITFTTDPVAVTGDWTFVNNPPQFSNPPVLGDDGVTKDYVDDSLLGYMDLISSQVVISGVKTFDVSPIVPDPTTAFQPANFQWSNYNFVSLLAVDQNIYGIKSFTEIPQLLQYASVNNDMTNKGFCDSAYVSLTLSPQTIAGLKTFSSELGVATPTLNTSATTKLYVDDLITGLSGLYMDLTSSQVVTSGTKTFDVLPQSAAVPAVDDDLTNKLFVDNSISGISGFMDLTSSQVVTSGTKTFDVLPQSSVVASVDDDLTNKLFVNNAITTATTGLMDLVSTQTVVSGTKWFNVLPKSTVVPTNDDELVNKLFVDNEIVAVGGQSVSNIYSDPSPFSGAGSGSAGLNTRNDVMKVQWSWTSGDTAFKNAIISIKYNLSTLCCPLFVYLEDTRFNDVGHINIHPFLLDDGAVDAILNTTTEGGSFAPTSYGLAYLGRSYYDWGQSFISNIFCNLYVEWIVGDDFVTLFTYNQNDSILISLGTPYQMVQVVNLNAQLENAGLYSTQTGSVALTPLDVQTKPWVP